MSHFSVIVIGPDVEGQLAPYDEDIAVEPYREPWDEDDLQRFREHFKISTKTARPIVERKMRQWNGCANVYDPKTKTWYRLSTYNPKSKWDWWVIGGRWTGFFKVKEGAGAMLGEPGVFGNEPEYDGDQVLKGDVDFEGMRRELFDQASETYDRYEAAIAGIDLRSYKPWPTFVEEVKAGKLTIDEARELYHEQSYVKALREADLMPWGGDDPSKLFESRESYTRRCTMSAAVPYAIVKDGEWWSQGRMGWWGMSDDDLTDDEWNEKVQELYDSLPDDTVLTCVDAHI